MSAIHRRAILEIAKTMVGDIINKVPVFQQLTQKLAEILGVQRCAVFKIIDDNPDGGLVEITAGIPVEEHGIGWQDQLVDHPDIAEALQRGTLMRISNPEASPLTAYFKEIITNRKIKEILYIPIYSRTKGKTVNLLVLDAVGEEAKFSQEELEFCREAGELISLLLHREEILRQNMRHLFINRLTTLGGSINRTNKLAQKIDESARRILKEVKRMEDIFSNDTGGLLG
ncbi:MAG: GAF domain-containing protein [Thermodesulfobacteriota bacterium]